MGVDVNYYVILGYNLDYNEVKNHNKKTMDEDAVEEKMESLMFDLYGKHTKNKKFIFISDGMSGEYEIFGKLIKEYDISDSGYSGDPFVIPKISAKDKKEVLALIKEAEIKTGLSIQEAVKDKELQYIIIFHHS